MALRPSPPTTAGRARRHHSNARSAGHVFVAAAGNNSSDNDQTLTYPASLGLDNVISVAATDRNGALASFSNSGAFTVDIAISE